MALQEYRTLLFASGLGFFLVWELLAPHHRPTSPRGPRWLANLSLSTVNAIVSAGLCAVCLHLAAVQGFPWSLQIFAPLDSTPWLRLAAEVLVLDCFIYWQHRLFHTVPLLWKFHAVHHTDLDLDVTSASRFHLGEIVVSALLKLAVALALGVSVAGLVLFECVLLLAAQFQHSNIALPAWLTRLLWFAVVPPEMHRVHHCPQRHHQDSNFGTLLTVWDWLFRTLVRPASHAPTFGVLPPTGPLRILALLRLPFTGWRKRKW